MLVPYTAFVAPGLLASSAMNGAMFDSTFNIFFKLKIAKTYDAILSTPLGVGDIALGELSWALMRGTLYSGAFLVVMAGLGYVVTALGRPVLAGRRADQLSPSPGREWPAPPSCAAGRTSTWSRWPSSPCSCSRPPSTRSPCTRDGCRLVVRCTPLYQGVALLRGLDLGMFSWSLAGHVLYLATMGTIGLAVTARRLARLLLP